MTSIEIAERLAGAFKPGVVLKFDMEVQSSSGPEVWRFVHRVLDPIDLGMIELPTGRIIAADPIFMLDIRTPFVQAVNPGRYPFSVVPARDPEGKFRAAFAVLRISESAPERWMPANPERPTETKVPVQECCGFGTDSGMGCYVDSAFHVQAMEAFCNGSMSPMETLSQHMKKASKYKIAALPPVPGANGGNIAVFNTGLGDGVFDSYWGLDQSGNPCVLVTDLNLGGRVETRRLTEES